MRAQLAGVYGVTQPLPTDPYLGLTLDEAQARAEEEGRLLVDRTRYAGRRADLVPGRVNVTLDAEGVVTAADWG